MAWPETWPGCARRARWARSSPWPSGRKTPRWAAPRARSEWRSRPCASVRVTITSWCWRRTPGSVVRMGLERIPEEDDELDPAFGDSRADLLVAAERAAEKQADLEAELGFEQGSRGPRGVQLVAP